MRGLGLIVGCLVGMSALCAQAQLTMPDLRQQIGFDQRIGAELPKEVSFLDEAGRPVHLGDFLGKRPVILALVYYECPMLCTLVLKGLLQTLQALSFTVGVDFDVVAISFDPKETPVLAAKKKDNTVVAYGRPESASGWHFLTGSQESIQAVTKIVGFRYAYDASTKEFAHPSGIMVITPAGKIAQYLYGIEYAPRDVRLAVVEASQGKLGSPIDQALLLCYQYDPKTGRYTVAVMAVLRLAGLATMLGLAAIILYYLRQERKNLRA